MDKFTAALRRHIGLYRWGRRLLFALTLLASSVGLGDRWVEWVEAEWTDASGNKLIYYVSIESYVVRIGGGRSWGSSVSGPSFVIPSEIDGYPVTAIGDYAFANCIGLTSVTIPDSVTSIGDGAFENCSSLTSVTTPDSVTSIGDSAFENCSSLTSVTIPSRVTSIGRWAFQNCGNLTSVTIPDGVTSIGESAFQDCGSLTSVTIPDGVTSIGGGAFAGCSSLSSVTIPDGVVSIGRNAFENCSSLTSVTIPDGVTGICAAAFNGCSSLMSVTIPNSVTNIGNDAFNGCRNLMAVTMPDGVTGIGVAAFNGCSSLMSVTIPDGVTSIGGYAFAGCSGLTSVTIPSSVTSIDYNTFWGCGGLTTVTIPDSVTSIGGSAFSDCSSLTSVTIPNSVTNIGDALFDGCSSLTSVTLPNGLTSIGTYTFFGCSNLTSVAIPDGVTCIDTGTFEGCSGLKSMTIPNSVKSIDRNAFLGCCSLMSMTIPNGVTNICSRAFRDCSSLTSVTIPDSVTWIGSFAFRGTSLVKVSLPLGAIVCPEAFDDDCRVVFRQTGTSPDTGRTDGAVDFSSATVYGGWLVDNDGAVAGTIQVKAAKAKANKKTGTTTSKLSVTIQPAVGKKVSLKGDLNVGAGTISITPKDGRVLDLALGENGMLGTFGDWVIFGARDVFSSKASADKAVANDMLAKWKGTLALVFDGGSLTVTVGAKGKAKVSGTLANGTKVSASAQMIVGDEWCCIPVVITKKNVDLAFNLWLSKDGKTADVLGLGGSATVGHSGALGVGAKLVLDTNALARLIGDGTYRAYFPNGVSVAQRGTKWVVADGAKAGKVVHGKDGAVDAAKAGANPSALKLSYRAKDGSFSGSFKAYVSARGKPKAVSVSVSGVVVNGVGYGSASVKKLGSIPVTIK